MTCHCVTHNNASLGDVITLVRDSVIFRVSATKMARFYLLISSLVRYRRIKAKKCPRLSRIAMFLREVSRCCSDQLFDR